MEYHLTTPLSPEKIRQLHCGDIVYLTGEVFTARDKAHYLMLQKRRQDIPFSPSEMALYHCGPLVKKTKAGWQVVSAGPTTSNRMEEVMGRLIRKYNIPFIIGKGGMGRRTREALRNHVGVYAAYPGGVGALAADAVQTVRDVFWLRELGVLEAVWVLTVKEFGPLIIVFDAHGRSLLHNNAEHQ
ncbi:MAG: fumarate hydratase C-terminal domain-containing protein [Candidatus Thermoplasmatota archaeon]|nr:fumarate hydratase C-terminal domain-containing protein [Candidatus Thermoplasmatota archaeon]